MTTTAKIIADSINPYGKRITTFELEYPRMVHAELLTHRMFSRNAASSRAIPIKIMIELVETNPAMPSEWGKNKAGMQADEQLTPSQQQQAESLWLASRDEAVRYAKVMASLGLHKQVVNRILEPYSHIKVVLTATDFENFWWLRCHKDADPTLKLLADTMWNVYSNSTPVELAVGQWHVPYVEYQILLGKQIFFDEQGNQITTEDALKLSSSCCAQVSYRKLNKEFEKAEDIYTRLIESERVHASPTEHQAKVSYNYPFDIEDGINALNLDGDYGAKMFISGNFTGGWIQHRQLIPNNVKLG